MEENKPFYAKIISKQTEEPVAGWNVDDIYEAEYLLEKIFVQPFNYYIVLVKKEPSKIAFHRWEQQL
jgi:hypothetical protein